MNPTVLRTFLWSGVVLIVAMIVAQGYMMGFIPPPPPSMPAEELRQHFIDNAIGIRIGTVIQCICWSFWNTWAISVAMFIRRMERGSPILTYASIANIGGGYVFFILIPMTWATISFRAETLDASIIQIMNDWVWFDWLFTWPPFAVWMLIIAAAIFGDHNREPIYPRWLAYFNMWSALLIFPAGLIVFFKTGPFAYNGAISFWFAFAVFFLWMLIMTIMTFRAVARVESEQNNDTASSSHGAAVLQAAV